MALNLAPTNLGAPFERLVSDELEQDSTYWSGIGVGCLPEHVLAEILRNASLDPHLVGSEATGFTERFQSLNYQSVAHSLFNFGHLGRFEFQLSIDGGSRFEIFANIPWRFIKVSGVTASDSTLLSAVNGAVQDYWVTWPDGPVALQSRIDGLTIPLTPRVLSPVAGDPFAWTVTVFPDAAATVAHDEFVWMADFTWSMRETFSFRPRSHDWAKAGRGPHEVGHMMGLPHDIGDRYSAMSDVENHSDRDVLAWRYSLGGDGVRIARPYAGHYKLFKIWAEMVFAQMGRLEDFVIIRPGA